jgi:hypothetical protein
MNRDPYLGSLVSGYTLIERIGSGRIGTVYKAVRSDPEDIVACKIIPEGRLRTGWQEEIKKNARLRSVPHVVPYHSYGASHDQQSRPLTFVLFDFIEGWNLREYCKNHREQINLPFVEGLLRTILAVLHACQAVGFLHGDLHEGNILVKKPDPRLPGSPVTLWVSDFGYGGSLNNVQPKDDFRQTAALTSALLRSLDPTSLTARDRLVREKLITFASKDLLEIDPMQGRHVTNPERLLQVLAELLQQAEGEAAAALSKSHSQDPADYLSAEALGNRREDWLQMFVPDFLAAEELLSRNITILTGARGCGKTMAFRRLTKFMDEMVGKPSGVRGSDQFVGFYMNCRDIAEAFPWLPRTLSPAAEQQLLHFFHLNWLSEVFRTMAVTNNTPNLSYEWLWSFMSKYFPAYSRPVQGVNALHFARAFIETQKEGCRQSPMNKAMSPKWNLATMDFLDSLQLELETNVAWAKGRPLYLFLDDYTIPLIPRTVQRVLNRAIFRRRDKIFFKVSTEAATSFDLSGLRNKPLELQQDFQLIDLATASLHQPLHEKLQLLNQVFLPRIDRHPQFKGKSIALDALLGPQRFNNTDIARQMRAAAQSKGKHPILYHGMEAFAGLWTSDFRTIIQVFVDMLRESSERFMLPATEHVLIEPKIQDKIVRAKGGEFVIFCESLTNPDQWHMRIHTRKKLENYGRHLRDIVEAFIAVSRWELTQGELVSNQGTLNPKQAFRLEILDKFELPKTALPYYDGLVRWHVFLQDWRGKSARGMLTPRLFLNRILIPYANLSFSTHDNIGLTNEEFIMLLQSPKIFPQYWERKQRRAKKRPSHENQSNIEFGKHSTSGDMK